jgi:GTP-binding protein HflX
VERPARVEVAQAAALHAAGGGLHDDDQVGVAQAALALQERGQRGLGEGQLLPAEQHDAQVAGAVGIAVHAVAQQLEHHGARALHVARPEPVDDAVGDPPGTVALGRHGVQVPGEQDQRAIAADRGAGRQAGVAGVVGGDAGLEQQRLRQRDRRLLVAGLRRAVDQLQREGGESIGQRAHRPTVPPSRTAAGAHAPCAPGAAPTGVHWEAVSKRREDRQHTTRPHDTTHADDLDQQRAADDQRAVIVGVLPEGDDLSELRELLRTAGVEVLEQMVQHRPDPHPNTYVGEGKLVELKHLADELGATVVVTDDELSPRQERNLEESLGMPVLDRTALILDIFATHANSAEGKLQVELAQLQYNLARMRGLWTHLDRLGVGGVGTRGPGETQIETDRRLARDRISKLQGRLRDVKGTRAVMRKERARSAHIPNIALAGYTNAGKSTVLNALTGSDVGVQDQLFHTLDPTTRELRWNGRTYLMTDTVGFIRKLPHHLVQAFGATLEETVIADLLLHVVDASVPDEQMAAVMAAVDAVLSDIGAANGVTPDTAAKRILVLNKCDLIDAERREELGVQFPDAVQIAAAAGQGLGTLAARIEEEFEATLRPIELLLPYAAGGTLDELHKLAGDLEQEHRPDGVLVRVRVPRSLVGRYDQYRLQPVAASDAADAR